MPSLCLECDTRVEPSLAKPGIYWCPGCDKEVERDETYAVGKRFFGKGLGAMMAMVGALQWAEHTSTSLAGSYPEDATNAYTEAKRQKRKKLKGLKMKQRRHLSKRR